MKYQLPTWPYVYGGPGGVGLIRAEPMDFAVTEQLSFELSGFGEHIFLQIQKTGENTEFVARQLAKFAGVNNRDIGYAGLKDRHAVTSQWFSVWLPGKPEPDWSQFGTETIKILQVKRHARKLHRGALKGNYFQIRVRAYKGDLGKICEQLKQIKALGVANYFGAQRFGHEGRNIDQASAMFQGARVRREQRSLYLSAARSFIFNHVLAHRIARNNWNQAISGDVMVIDNSNSSFQVDYPNADIVDRVGLGNIHPTGVLWGKGNHRVSGEARKIERTVVDMYSDLASGLIDFSVAVDRRALRVNVRELNWQTIADNTLELAFFLPGGSYATALLREIVQH